MIFSKLLNNRRLLVVFCGISSSTAIGLTFAFWHSRKNRLKWPQYDQLEVFKHRTKENGIWVTYKNGVYNISEFIQEHPGGTQILEAAGKAIDPFWETFTIHLKPEIFELLESMKIGELNDYQKTNDPNIDFNSKWKLSSKLRTISDSPLNCETIPKFLTESFLTKNDDFYIRNHMNIPEIALEEYKLTIEIEDGQFFEFDFNNLINKCRKNRIIATIMCAGNRRNEMSKVKMVRGLDWTQGAIGTAEWTGIRLLDFLNTLHIDLKQFKHVHFEGYDYDASGNPYKISIPIEFVMDTQHDIILAYEMNGHPIPQMHGYPIRAIIPGVIGARNVKWLKKITLSSTECDSHWQQNDYKSFSPNADWATVDFKTAPAIYQMPITSVICNPQNNQTVRRSDNFLHINGYAFSGAGNKIIRVDISIDQGKSWQTATLNNGESFISDNQKQWQWSLWSLNVPISSIEVSSDDTPKSFEIWVKATDSNYNSQPETFENIWNLRGVLANAYHKIRVSLV